MLSGVDVSHHQGAIDWRAVARSGQAFAWCKASEGTSFRDSRFGPNWAGTRANGIVRGAYHFLRSDSDPRAQARHFLAVVGELSGSMAALDVESSGASRPTAAQARAFKGEFDRLAGGHPLVIYTGRWYWRGVLGDPFGADLGPLWHSAYTSSPGALYGGWPRFTFWQYTQSGRCPGIPGNVDLNQFFGDRAALAALQEERMTPEERRWLDRELDTIRTKVESTFNQVNLRTGTLSNKIDALAATLLAQQPGDVDDEAFVEALAAAIPDSLADKVVDQLQRRSGDG
ncbi:MAG: glycoside hydrolase family 25 protein [Acidimicrobiales bacterium]